MNKLSQLLRDEMDRRGLTVRQVANQLSLSHVTVTRILAALPVDVQTMMTVCDWLGVTLVDVIDQKPTDANLAQRLAVLINREPKLGAALAAALSQVEKGEMDAEDLRDIAEYATYKIEHRRVRRKEAQPEG